VALIENSPENLRALFECLPGNGPALFFSPIEIDFTPDWQIKQFIKGVQMLFGKKTMSDEANFDGSKPNDPGPIVPLTPEHVPQMIALTRLTDPGPFGLRTIEFGHYYGIFKDGQLVSMAGQRLHVFGYAEISAVCTHPGHTGKGYARRLLSQQLSRIISGSKIPFLHVRADNERAIKVYESLGFYKRREVCFYVIQKAK
jgi:GNAT superfamily N-acetyltransferase